MEQQSPDIFDRPSNRPGDFVDGKRSEDGGVKGQENKRRGQGRFSRYGDYEGRRDQQQEQTHERQNESGAGWQEDEHRGDRHNEEEAGRREHEHRAGQREHEHRGDRDDGGRTEQRENEHRGQHQEQSPGQFDRQSNHRSNFGEEDARRNDEQSRNDVRRF
ncbi:unnamed protein product [Sphagnum balticum]